MNFENWVAVVYWACSCCFLLNTITADTDRDSKSTCSSLANNICQGVWMKQKSRYKRCGKQVVFIRSANLYPCLFHILWAYKWQLGDIGQQWGRRLCAMKESRHFAKENQEHIHVCTAKHLLEQLVSHIFQYNNSILSATIHVTPWLPQRIMTCLRIQQTMLQWDWRRIGWIIGCESVNEATTAITTCCTCWHHSVA